MVAIPWSSDTAKNGWGSTPAYALIHGWTLHLNFTITSGFANFLLVFIPLTGWAILNGVFAVGLALTLWRVASLLMMSNGWFTCNPKTRGWYQHPDRSSAT